MRLANAKIAFNRFSIKCMESDEDVREVVKKAFSSKILLKGPFSTLPFKDITLWKTWNLEGQLIV